MTVRTRNRLIAFSILTGPFIFLLCLLIFWEAEPLPPVPPLPNPNGYNDLVKAGEMLVGNISTYDEMDEDRLHALVTTNSAAIQLARRGLQQRCQVALDYSPTTETILIQHSAILELALAFAAEGSLAEAENRTNNAIEYYLDLVRLGNASARGGIIIDQQVGITIEALGVEQLQKLVDELDTKSCREIAATLETLDSQRQTWSEVMQQERDWSRRAFPGIRNEFIRLMQRNSMRKFNQKIEQQFDKRRKNTRRLMIDFAARAYELNKGHPPATLSDLAPDYLKVIPQDLFTGTNMVYQPVNVVGGASYTSP